MWVCKGRMTGQVVQLLCGITVLCHFRKNDLMSDINCLTCLTFGSLLHVISIPF